MKVSYSNDPAKGPGHGILRCSEAGVAAEGCTFALQRSTGTAYLNSRQEWLQQQVFLCPRQVVQEGEDILLHMGPDVVNELDTQETYRLHLRAADGSIVRGGLRVNDVIRASGTYSGAMIVPPAAEEPSPSDPPVPAAQDAPAQQDTVEEPSLNEREDAAGQGVGGGQGQAKDQRSRLWWILVLLLLILAAGFVFWWYLQQDGTPEPSTPLISGPASSPASEPESEPTPAPEPNAAPAVEPEVPAEPGTPPGPPSQADLPEPPAVQAEESKVPLTAKEQVTLFFGREDRTPAAAAALSRSLPSTTNADQEAVYLLYYYAGENGEASVLMDYAACLDPTRPAWGSINKDPVAAWDIYEKARVAGLPGAEKAQQDMKIWLQTQAVSGNAQAAHWLRQMP